MDHNTHPTRRKKEEINFIPETEEKKKCVKISTDKSDKELG